VIAVPRRDPVVERVHLRRRAALAVRRRRSMRRPGRRAGIRHCRRPELRSARRRFHRDQPAAVEPARAGDAPAAQRRRPWCCDTITTPSRRFWALTCVSATHYFSQHDGWVRRAHAHKRVRTSALSADDWGAVVRQTAPPLPGWAASAPAPSQ